VETLLRLGFKRHRSIARRGHRHLCGHGPQKAHPRTGHRHHHLVGVLPAGHEAPGAFTTPNWSFPADGLATVRWCFEPHVQVSTDCSRIARRPGPFDQTPTGRDVTSLRDGALPAPLGTAVGLHDKWWSWGRTDDRRAPSEMSRVPGGPARVAASVSEHEGCEPKRGGRQLAYGVLVRPSEIPSGVVLRLGHRDRGEIPGAPQAGQWHRVTALGLAAGAGLRRGGRAHARLAAS
jgi:hypothetical protein